MTKEKIDTKKEQEQEQKPEPEPEPEPKFEIMTYFDKFLNQLNLVDYKNEDIENLNNFFDKLSPTDFESFIKKNPKAWSEYKNKLFNELNKIENVNIYVPFLYFKTKFNYDLIDSSPIDNETFTMQRNEIEQNRKKIDSSIIQNNNYDQMHDLKFNKICLIVILSLMSLIFIGVILIILKLFLS